MTVYIEYAFLENFLLDFLLLRLALKGGKERTKFSKIALGACVGGVFALVYPFLRLPKLCLLFLKVAVAALMCAVAFDKMKTKNEQSRYAFTVVLFFVFSFSAAGALTFFRADGFYIFVGFGWVCVFAELLVKAFYRKKAEKSGVYACKIAYKRQKIHVFGLYDTGNLACYQNVPVCFVSPDVLYDLLGEDFYKSDGQVCDEIVVHTISGEKRLPVYLGQIIVNGEEKRTYFAPGAHIVNKAYAVLINRCILVEEDGKKI